MDRIEFLIQIEQNDLNTQEPDMLFMNLLICRNILIKINKLKDNLDNKINFLKIENKAQFY